MTDETTPTDQLRFERTYTTDVDYVGRLVKSFAAYNYSQPSTLVRIALLLVLGTGVSISASLSEGPGPAYLVPTTAVVVFALILIGVLIGFRLNVGRLRKQLAATVPVNSNYAIGFRRDTMMVRGPLSNVEVSYRAYESVATRGDFVFLKNRGARVRTLLPGQLFTPESLAYLREKIGQPTKS